LRFTAGKRNLLSLNSDSRPRHFRASSITGRMRRFFFVHQPQRLRRRRVGPHAQNAPLHHVGNFRRDIGDEFRRGHAECLQHEINPLVGVAGSARPRLGHAGAPLEFRVADGGADGVGVGIFVADDEDFAHAI